MYKSKEFCSPKIINTNLYQVERSKNLKLLDKVRLMFHYFIMLGMNLTKYFYGHL